MECLGIFPSGRSRAASAGKLPQGCLQWGRSIPRHFKCTSRRGIWHLNSCCMFFHHLQLVNTHSRPACLRILLCSPVKEAGLIRQSLSLGPFDSATSPAHERPAARSPPWSEIHRKPTLGGWDGSPGMEIVVLGGEDRLVGLHLDNLCEVVSIISVWPRFTYCIETHLSLPSLGLWWSSQGQNPTIPGHMP